MARPCNIAFHGQTVRASRVPSHQPEPAGLNQRCYQNRVVALDEPCAFEGHTATRRNDQRRVTEGQLTVVGYRQIAVHRVMLTVRARAQHHGLTGRHRPVTGGDNRNLNRLAGLAAIHRGSNTRTGESGINDGATF